MRPRTVLVAHRETMVAEGVAAALDRFPGIVSVGVASSAREAADHGARTDAVAMDRSLRGADEAATHLRRQGVRVVFIGVPDGEPDDEGVSVSTAEPVANLATALAPGSAPMPEWGGPGLTTREREILSLAARGVPGKQVARQLGISVKTVENHKSRIFRKLRVPNQTAAVSLAMAGSAGGGGASAWSPSSI